MPHRARNISGETRHLPDPRDENAIYRGRRQMIAVEDNAFLPSDLPQKYHKEIGGYDGWRLEEHTEPTASSRKADDKQADAATGGNK